MDKKVKGKKIVLSIVLALLLAGVSGILVYMHNTSNANNKSLADYKNFTIEATLNEVNDEDINDTVKSTIDNAGGIWVDAEDGEALKEGYMATIEYYEEGDKDCAEVMEVKVGEQMFPEEFGAAIGSMKLGDSTTVILSEEYGGRAYVLTILSAKKPSYDITDEYVESLGIENVSTVDELKENIREYLSEQYENTYKDDVREEIRTSIIKNSESYTEAPTALVEAFKTDINAELKAVLDYYNSQLAEGEEEKTLDDVLKPYMEKASFDGTAEEYIVLDANNRVNECLIFEQIAKNEKITLEDDELYGYISKKLNTQAGKEATFDDVSAYIESVGRENAVKMCLKDKVLDNLVDFYTGNNDQ